MEKKFKRKFVNFFCKKQKKVKFPEVSSTKCMTYLRDIFRRWESEFWKFLTELVQENRNGDLMMEDVSVFGANHTSSI